MISAMYTRCAAGSVGLTLLGLVACSGQSTDETGRGLNPASRQDGGAADGASADGAEPLDGEAEDGELGFDADEPEGQGEQDTGAALDAETGDAGLEDATLDASSPDAELLDADLPDAELLDAEQNDAQADGSAPDCDAGIVGSRIQISFDSLNAERVTSLRWLDSTGTLAPEVVAQGGPLTCGDPSEFFGASYGASEGTSPYPVWPGSRSKLSGCGMDLTILADETNCAGQPQIPVTTAYRFYAGEQASQFRITRTFGFGASSPAYTSAALHTYLPRVPLSQYTTVIYPKQDGINVTTTLANSCPNDCVVPIGASWNGAWFADVDPASGRAIIVVRDASSSGTPRLTINYDSYSSSNLTSFAIARPTTGWQEPQTAVEYICFADLTSWPATQRNAAVLPANCGVE